MVRFTAFDVREKVSQTAVPLGFAEISLGVIQDTARLRIPIRCQNINVGFVTIVTYSSEEDKKMRLPAKVSEQSHGHRRSQSLPPKLGVKLFVPAHMKLSLIFTNPNVSIYHLVAKSNNMNSIDPRLDPNISTSFRARRRRH